MAEFSIDRFVELYAERAAGMSASEVRALFAVASRPEIVSFAGGMPYVQALPPADVLAVVADALDVHGSTILQYAGGQGHLSLRERLIPLMTDEGVEADPDDMVITTGAQQALDLIGKIFIDPGDLIAVEAPAYVGALTAFGAYQPRYLQIDLDADGMIVDQLEEALVRGERPKFVYTVPNFGNPAGVTMSLPRRRQLVALCREAGIPIIEDNPYGLLRFEGDALPCLRSMDPENVIYLGTVSKVFSPGVRVGWALAEQSVVQRLGAREGGGRPVRVVVHHAGDRAVLRRRSVAAEPLDVRRSLPAPARCHARGVARALPVRRHVDAPGGWVLRLGHTARMG